MATTVEVNARLGLIDNLTNRLGAVARYVDMVAGRFDAAGASSFRFGSAVAAGTAAAGFGLARFAIQGQAEIDEALRRFQLVGTTTDQTRRDFEKLVMRVGPRIGTQQLDLIRGATDFLQAGLSPEDLMAQVRPGVALIERLGAAARISNVPLSQLATDVVTLARSFNMPWSNAEERAKTLERIMGIAAVAPRLSPDTPAGHVRGLAAFGAIAAQLGMPIEHASTLQNLLSSSGSPNAMGGNALKTILQRFLNPTPAAIAQLQAAGFNYGRAFQTNVGALDATTFIDALRVSGIDARGQRGLIARMIARGDGGDLMRWRTELAEGIAGGLGLGRGQVRERRALAVAVNRVIAGQGGGINTAAWLEELSKLPIAAFRDVAGLHHASRAAVLAFQGKLAEFAANLGRLERESPTAIDDGSRVLFQGWAHELNRLEAIKTLLRNEVWNTGMGGSFTETLKTLNDQLERLGQADPATLKAIGDGLIYIGGAGATLIALGATLGAIALSLRTIATYGPAAVPFLAVGGLGVVERNRMLAGQRNLDVARQSDPNAAGDAPFAFQSLNNFMRVQRWFRGLFNGGGGEQTPLPSLSGMSFAPGFQGTTARVEVTVRAEDGARITGTRTEGNVELRLGESMPDANSPLP